MNSFVEHIRKNAKETSSGSTLQAFLSEVEASPERTIGSTNINELELIIHGWLLALETNGVEDTWAMKVLPKQRELLGQKFEAPNAAPISYILTSHTSDKKEQLVIYFEALHDAASQSDEDL